MGAKLTVVHTSAMELCLSAEEYVFPVSAQRSYGKKSDVAVNVHVLLLVALSQCG